MKNKKLSGSFYTPKNIADFLVSYLSDKLKDKKNISVLEPSAGDGVFIKSLYNHDELSNKIVEVFAVEQNNEELNKIVDVIKEDSFFAINSDFLDFQKDNEKKFTLVIGNPPYLKSNLLRKSQIEQCKSIHQLANLSKTKPKNIWTSFLVRSINFTSNDGIIAFILPSELLQVKFAEELRELIIKEFERVEIFTFNELLFEDCKGQDTLLLIGERKSQYKGVFYCNIGKVSDLNDRKFYLSQNIKVKDSKWNHYHLETDEIELLEKLKQHTKTIDDICNSKAGIVTAANDYFIVNEKTVIDYSLQDLVKPIIQKGVYVNGCVDFKEEDFQFLVDRSIPSFLIAINNNSLISSNVKFWEYIKIGEGKKIQERYKTSIRKKWYEIPNIGIVPEAFFFKRCNEYPKLIKNSANVLSTDSAYAVRMKEDFNVESLIYSFYNSMTLAFAELYGRHYGGGVLELTPNEFKKIPIPYTNLSSELFQQFAFDFKNKSSIKDICLQNDKIILQSFDEKLDSTTIDKVFQIREKLFLRRIKKS